MNTDSDGFQTGKLDGKFGIRASSTAELSFNDIRAPEENLVCEREYGSYYFKEFFNITRIEIIAQGFGLSQGALDEALEYAQERETFRHPL